MTFRRKVYEVLEFSRRGRQGMSLYINLFLVAIIVLNAIVIIIHTIPQVRQNKSYEDFFQGFEAFSVGVFTIEYFLRLWSCVENPRYQGGWRGRLRYIFSFWAIIDFLGTFPFYIHLIANDLVIVRTLRVVRLFRLFRVNRYSHALQIIKRVLVDTKEELLLSLSFILITLLVASSIMYYLENAAQPEAFSSIPATLWWGVITMTTTGYGDMFPITPWGKFFGGFILILGIALFALPTGIIASGFMKQIERQKKNHKIRCPHCGQWIDLREHFEHES
ncbi:MAG: ion transporter [Runella sp.]